LRFTATPDFASGRSRPVARETVMAKSASAKVIKLGGDVPTRGGDEAISFSEPYSVEVAIEGVADILFHRWNVGRSLKKPRRRRVAQRRNPIMSRATSTATMPG
jgi:hypothetical protein